MSAREVAYQSINVVASEEGLAQLHQLGAHTVPVVAKGDDYVNAISLQNVNALLGLDAGSEPSLTPAELVQRLDGVLSAAMRYVRQLPDDQMSLELPGRPRRYSHLTHHIFQIACGFMTVTKGGELTSELLAAAPGDEIVSFAQIADAGEAVRREMLDWWESAGADTDFNATVQTYYGPQTCHEVLERTTWHAAQHARQVMFILQEQGIEPDGPLGERDLAGLPLPKEVWDG